MKTSCNLSIISFGVPLGATIARAEPNITGYPLSVKVGISSKPSNLLSVNEANILNSPDLAKLATSLILATVALTWSPRRAEIISVLPPNGTWVTCIPASFAKWAATIWLEAPVPLLEIVNSSGWAFA